MTAPTGSGFGSNREGTKQEPAGASLDAPRIEFLDRLTPRQAVLLHYMWGLATDALMGDTLMFDTRIRNLDAYARAMRTTRDGQRQADQITARITNLGWQFTAEERLELGIVIESDLAEHEASLLATMTRLKCGLSDNVSFG
jgi:hypothetical protein